MELMQANLNTQVRRTLLATTESECEEVQSQVPRDVLVMQFKQSLERAIDLELLAHAQRLMESIPTQLRDEPVLLDLAGKLPSRPKSDHCELQIEVQAYPGKLEVVSA